MPVVLAAALEIRTLEVPAELRRPIRIECAVGALTRVVFPEQLLTLRWSKGAREALGARLRSTEPVGIVEVQPARLAASSSVEAHGPSWTLNLELTVVPTGAPLEIRIVLTPGPERATALDEVGQKPRDATPVGDASGEGDRGVVSAGHERVDLPAATGAVSSELSNKLADLSALSKVDLAGLLAAEVVPIGRREVQPGRRDVVLVDALRGENWVWLRFAVRGGARESVEGVRWEHGAVDSYLAEASGEDLRIVVQVPRALVESKSKVTLQVAGGEYRFPLNSGTLGAFLRGLFR
jgi:hypothetical protein